MNSRTTSLNDQEAASWLREAWELALASDLTEDDPQFDDMHRSGLVSIRYALVTQLLGKFAQPSRDALCLQRGRSEGAESAGRWDPRSFCSKVIVPWVQDSDGVLGSSNDPYVSKPLRRSRLDDWNTPLRQKSEWENLVQILDEVESSEDEAVVEAMLRRCLRSIARRYQQLQVSFPVPRRVSLEQTIEITEKFLSQKSGGERPLIVADALMRTVGKAFGLFDEVLRQGVNEADSVSNAAGDIICVRTDEEFSLEDLVLAVEVKDRSLTLVELNASIEKARANKVPALLFVVPNLDAGDKTAIERRASEEWTLGTNIYFGRLTELMRTAFAFMDESYRREFLHEVGIGINKLAVQPTLRLVWSSLLTDIGQTNERHGQR